MTHHPKWSVKDNIPDQDSVMQHTMSNGEFAPYRALMHETIIQLVTERKITAAPDMDYGECLHKIFSHIRQTDEYNELLSKLDDHSTHDRKAIADLLDKMDIPRLTEVPKEEHETIMVLGSPGAGKSAIVRRLTEKNWDAYSNAAIVDPDSLRYLLFTTDGTDHGHRLQDHGIVTQAEASFLATRITGRLSEKLKQGHAPNIVLDVVFPWGNRMDLPKNSSKVFAYLVSAPVEVCLERSYERSKTGLMRAVDTEYLIRANQGISQLTPVLFTLENLEFQIYDTGRSGRFSIDKIADFDSEKRILKVHDQEAFLDIVRRQHCSLNAKSNEELYAACQSKEEYLSWVNTMYGNKGVTIAYDEETHKAKPAVSRTRTKPSFGKKPL